MQSTDKDEQDPYTGTMVNRIVQAVIDRQVEEATSMQVNGPMRDELRIMYDLIGRGGFWMMGVQNTPVGQVLYDNDRLMLSWQMGGGALVDKVEFYYEESEDLYRLGFITDTGEAGLVTRELIGGVYAEDVQGIIEAKTGFCLTLPRFIRK